jgi:ComF family protein
MASEYKRMIQRGWLEARHIASRLLHDALPAQCSYCALGLTEPEQSSGLCTPCQTKMARFRLSLQDRCQICADALPCPRCTSSTQTQIPFERTIAALPYLPEIRELILLFKFSGRQDLARALAVPLAQQWRCTVHETGLPTADALIPLPLTRERLAERGFNQSWLLSQALRARLRSHGLAAPPLRQWLRRRASTDQPQVHLSQLSRRERALQTQGVFLASAQVRGKRIYLLDDVMTTGATMHAAALALRQQGAKEVLCLVLARA